MKNERLWKNLAKKLEPVEENGEVVGLRWKSRDPSLGDQLAERRDLVDAERSEAYLEACRKAPHASEGTKRKWRRRLGF
jgi:hypothetical protein